MSHVLRILTVLGLGTGMSVVGFAGPLDPPKAPKPGFKSVVAPKPATALAPAPRPFSSPGFRTFGGTHIGRPFSSPGNRPLAAIGNRPLASNLPGSGGPELPLGPGGMGPNDRPFVAVESIGSSEPGLESAQPLPQEPYYEPEQPALEPALEPLAPVPPSIDPIVAEMAARLRSDGHAQFLRAEFHLAESTLRSAVDLVPNSAESSGARFELAFALLALGRVNSAAKEFQIAEADDPTIFKTPLEAAALVGTKTFDRCVVEAAQYLAAYPIDSDALFVDALMQWWSGRAREAGLDLERLATIDPKYAGLSAVFVPAARDEALKPQ